MECKKHSVITLLNTVKVGRKLWMTTRPHFFLINGEQRVVDEGFLFDHASVPRTVSNIVPPVKSCIAEASLWHDAEYCKDSEWQDRKGADKALKYLTIAKGLSVGGKDKALANIAYIAVRAASNKFWNKQWNFEKMADVYDEYKGHSLAELQDLILGHHETVWANNEKRLLFC